MSLDSAIQHLLKAKRISNTTQSYAKDNPVESQKVFAYLGGGARPTGVTSEMGLGLLEVEDERRPAPPPPPPPPPPPGTVTPPTPPSAYSVPAGAVAVSTSAQLIAALSGSGKDIVLENGTYDNGSPFNNTGGHRVYARNLLGATLKAGFNVGGSGCIFRGLKFDTVAGSKLPGDSSQIFGGATNMQVLDCEFLGNWTTKYGVRATNPQGLICERLRFIHFRDVSLRASDNVRVAYKGATPRIKRIVDIFADGCSYDPPGSSGGVAEAAVWVGHPVDEVVARLDLRDVGRKALETVNSCYDTTFRDFSLDQRGPHAQAVGSIGVGVYLEHNNHYNIFEKFHIIGVNRGFNGEWNEGHAGDAGAQHCIIRNGTVDADGWTRGGNTAGVYLDTGCDSNQVYGCTFKNQNWAGVGAHNNIGTNVFEPNTYQMKPTALPLRTTHIFN